MTTHIAVGPDGTHRCYRLARDGRTRIPFGCSHATPREGIAHDPAPRSADDPNLSSVSGGEDSRRASGSPEPSGLPSSGHGDLPTPRPAGVHAGGTLELGL